MHRTVNWQPEVVALESQLASKPIGTFCLDATKTYVIETIATGNEGHLATGLSINHSNHLPGNAIEYSGSCLVHMLGYLLKLGVLTSWVCVKGGTAGMGSPSVLKTPITKIPNHGNLLCFKSHVKRWLGE